mmetsp:Transcript_99090/g.308794  ORF Transcript_99090/g.308794 Transcript_99090/m.308794 type:complete len:208 (+) Transcript_99090:381-1004(+)
MPQEHLVHRAVQVLRGDAVLAVELVEEQRRQGVAALLHAVQLVWLPAPGEPHLDLARAVLLAARLRLLLGLQHSGTSQTLDVELVAAPPADAVQDLQDVSALGQLDHGILYRETPLCGHPARLVVGAADTEEVLDGERPAAAKERQPQAPLLVPPVLIFPLAAHVDAVDLPRQSLRTAELKVVVGGVLERARSEPLEDEVLGRASGF